MPGWMNDRRAVKFGKVFTALQVEREKWGISEYSLSQPTLEQVFIRFAREQEQGQEEQPTPL